jgi:hypothetical protein
MFLSIILIFYHLILPLLLPIDFSRLELLQYVWHLETHYSMVLGAAERLIQGGTLLKNVSINYGLFSPILIVALDEMFGRFNLADYVRLQQFANIIFFTFVMLAYGKTAKWQMHILFFGTLLILPWINNLPEWVATPNQTGLRFLGFSLTLLFFSYCSSFSANFRSIIAGALASFCIFLNTETGIILFIVLIAFVFFNNTPQKWGNFLAKIVLFLFTFSITSAVLLFFTTKVLATPPQFEDFIKLFQNMLMFLGGFGGTKLPFLSVGLVLLCHAGYIVIRSTIKWGFSSLNLIETVRMCVALTMIGWLAYYFNRPDTQNLWTIIVLYGYLLIPLLDRKYLKLVSTSFPRMRIAIPLVLVIITLLPLTIKFHMKSIPKTANYLKEIYKQDRITTDTYSGVILKKDVVNYLERKARFIKSLPKNLKFEFMTAFSFTIPIESQHSSLGLPQDIFIEVLRKTDQKYLLKKLIASQPDQVLFDDYSIFGGNLTNWESYYERWKARISTDYRLERTTDGWHVFVKK